MLYFTGSAAEKSIAALQTAWNQERIGRDKLPRFSNWHSREAAAVRYIRMACEVLGPTGDEKSGCRDLWLAYCSMMELKSTIPSYKDNRFNSVFVAAVSILQHRMDIISCQYSPAQDGHHQLSVFSSTGWTSSASCRTTCQQGIRNWRAFCKMPSVRK